MELDQLKESWDKASDSNQPLDQSTIEKMIHKKYSSGMKKIAYPELTGTGICLLGIVFVILKFNQLDSLYLQSTGVISIVLLGAVSLISLLSVQHLKMNRGFDQYHISILKTFAQHKLQFYRLQKINAILCYALLVTAIILIAKIFRNNDIIKNQYFWTISLGLGYIFLLSFSKYVNRFYKKTIEKNEELLKVLEDNQ